MYQVEGVDEGELRGRIEEDALSYVEENILRVRLGESTWQVKDNDLYSPKFKSKSLKEICRDSVLVRIEKGIDANRAKHEGLGVTNLISLLQVMQTGEVAAIISPPDPRDKTMDGYSMVYLYEKQDRDRIWFGAVRDENRKLKDWQEFAERQSMWQARWEDYDHLQFVALPFVAKEGLGKLLNGLGIRQAEEIPEWINREIESTARLITKNIQAGSLDTADKILDSFKIAVIAGRKRRAGQEIGYQVLRMVNDQAYFDTVHQGFLHSGGEEILEAAGLCGDDVLSGEYGGKWEIMNKIINENNLVSQAMGIKEGEVETTSSETMKCVECPFCHKTVDAIVTSSTIKCPECNEEVNKG